MNVEKLAWAQAIIVALFLAGCPGQSLPQHVEWVRADGKPLTSQFDLDATACRAEPQKVNRLGDAGPAAQKAKAIDDVFARCMASRGYIELRQDIR
jgi:hypothetical protein